MIILAPCQQPATRPIGRGLSVTLRPVEYIFDKNGQIFKIVIPAGFDFDGASIPRIFWTLLGLAPHGDMDGPSLPHDFIYHYQGKVPEGCYFLVVAGRDILLREPVPKALADDLLHALCLWFGVTGRVRGWLIRSAVSVGGWVAWRRNDPARKHKLTQSEQHYATE